MYWPTGSASRISVSSTFTLDSLSHPSRNQINSQEPQPDELLGIASCPPFSLAPNGLFATWTLDELTIWSTKPKAVVTKLRRSKPNLQDLGKTREVKWKTGETPMLIILTTKSNLLIYDLTPLTPSSSTVYSLPPNLSSSFLLTGPAERVPFPKLVLRPLGEFLRRTEDEHISCFEPSPTHLLVCIARPSSQLRSLPWPSNVDSPRSPFRHTSDQQSSQSQPSSTSYLANLDWLVNRSVTVVSITYSGPLSLYIFVTSDGRAYLVHRVHSPPTPGCIAAEPIHWVGRYYKGIDSPATGACAINVRFSLVALALDRGVVVVYALGYFTSSTTYSHTLNLATSLNNLCRSDTGPVNMCSWTSDGHALAVSWTNGFSVWSVFGRLQAWGNGLPTDEEGDTVRDNKWQDVFMGSGRSLFWGPGNFELFLLTRPHSGSTKWICDEQLFVLPFAKSAVTTLHSPDNTKHAFLQLDDRVLAYRGADSPDMSVINPESDVWQHIKIPSDYISTNWPIEMSCISDDGKLVAVAGRKGLTHFNSVSGRWKLFEREEEEQAFCVRGGMQWIGNVLVVGCNEGGLHSIRLFSRDNPLNMSHCLCDHTLPAPIVLLSIYDTSLLVYTGDNTLHHFLIASDGLTPCGSIGFEGVVGTPSRVRGMSWLIPNSQHRFGDPSNDLNHATIIFLIDGKVVLLRPGKSEADEVKYDLQILADRIEFYWAGRQSDQNKNTLANSLWGWDGSKIWVWLDALRIEDSQLTVDQQDGDGYAAVEGNLTIPLSFHPLAVLMDKGIIIGVEHETSIRKSFDFAMFRITTNTHLFIHHILRFHLSRKEMTEAICFATYYSPLVYFSHSLEVLLHAVLEDEADSNPVDIGTAELTTASSTSSPSSSRSSSIHVIETSQQKGSERVLPLVVEFLDHFQEALQVVVGCARKTDVKQWGYLFSVVGKPRHLFEKSLEQGLLKIAASYLLVLHNLDTLEQSSRDTIRLYKVAMAAKDWALCKELLRFLFSLDRTGVILKTALDESKSGKDDLLMRTPPNLSNGTNMLVNAIDGIHLEDTGMGFASPPRHTHLNESYSSVDQK
ncbi:RIC1-domain-containing protein [Melampsora americana]|nr:RIC1-domain-containing protein [Melampsora americana]